MVALWMSALVSVSSRLLAVCFSLVIGGGYEARHLAKGEWDETWARHSPSSPLGHTTPRLLLYTANAICICGRSR